MIEDTKQIGLRLPLDVVAFLERKAAEDDRPLAYVARKILMERMQAEEGGKPPKKRSK